MGPLEIVLLVVAAVILAVNQALRDSPAITDRFGWLSPRGWWNYVPLVFVTVAGIVWLFSPSPSLVADRGVKISGIPASAIENVFEGRTDVEAKRIIAAYEGRAVEVTGAVRDVHVTDIAVINEKFASVFLASELDKPGLHLTFEEPALDVVSNLRRGEIITAKCQFDAKDTDAQIFSFDDCQLIDGPHPPSN
jgi:hypothetical protein